MCLRSRSIRATLGSLAVGLLLTPIRAEAGGFHHPHHYKTVIWSNGPIVGPTTAVNSVAVTPNTLTLPTSGMMVSGLSLAPAAVSASSISLVPVSLAPQPASLQLTAPAQSAATLNLQLPASSTTASGQSVSLSLPASTTPAAGQTVTLQLPASLAQPAQTQVANLQLPVSLAPSGTQTATLHVSGAAAGQQSVNLQLPVSVAPSSGNGTSGGASGVAALAASLSLPAAGDSGGPPPSAVAAQFPLLASQVGDNFLARLKSGLVNVVKAQKDQFQGTNPNAPKNIENLGKLVHLLLGPVANDVNAGNQIADLVKSVVNEGLLGPREKATPAVAGGDPTKVEVHIYIHVIDPAAAKGGAKPADAPKPAGEVLPPEPPKPG